MAGVPNDPLFLDPRLTELYDTLASWENEISIKGRVVQRRLAEYEFFMPLVMESASVLDVGCGTGELLRIARRSGHSGRLCGVEPAEPMLRIARKQTDIEWLLGEAADGGWDREFDLVLLTGHVFQVILEDDAIRRTLAAARAALTGRGRFVFDTRNPLVRDWETWTPDVVWEFAAPDGAVVRKWHDLLSVDGDMVAYSTTYVSERWPEPITFESAQRFHSAEVVAALLAEAGLDIEEQFGHWDRRPFTGESPEIVTIARVAGS